MPCNHGDVHGHEGLVYCKETIKVKTRFMTSQRLRAFRSILEIEKPLAHNNYKTNQSDFTFASDSTSRYRRHRTPRILVP